MFLNYAIEEKKPADARMTIAIKIRKRTTPIYSELFCISKSGI